MRRPPPTGGPLRLLAFSDWRSQDLDLPQAILDEVGMVDLILYAGDDVARLAVGPSEAERMRTMRDAARLVRGTGVAQPWCSDEPELIKDPGFGVIFAGMSGVALTPLVGELMHAPDSRVGAILRASTIRDLLSARVPAAWACGWSYSEMDGAPADIHAAAIAHVLEEAAAAPMTPVLGSAKDQLPEAPPGLSDLLRLALGTSYGDAPNRLARLATRTRFGLAGVIGNDCRPDDAAHLRAPGVHDLHAAPLVISGWGFQGLQGAPGHLGPTTYSERAAWRHLRGQQRALPRELQGRVVVSHAPPNGTLDLAMRYGIAHIGSTSLARFASKHASLVVCGHVHREGGRSAALGQCTVANVSNHDHHGSSGKFALIDLAPDVPPVVTWIDEDLEGLGGTGPMLRKGLRLRGVHTLAALERLLSANPPDGGHRAGPVPGLGRERSRRLTLHLRAIREREILRDPERPSPPMRSGGRVYLGLQHTQFLAATGEEWEPPRVWCISLLGRARAGPHHYQARARGDVPYRRELTAAICALVADIEALGAVTIVSWGGRLKGPPAARWTLETIARELGLGQADSIAGWQWQDLRAVCRSCLVPPARTWNLADIREALSGKRRAEDIDGYMAGVMYSRWVEGGEEPPWDELLAHAELTLGSLAEVDEAARAALGTPP